MNLSNLKAFLVSTFGLQESHLLPLNLPLLQLHEIRSDNVYIMYLLQCFFIHHRHTHTPCTFNILILNFITIKPLYGLPTMNRFDPLLRIHTGLRSTLCKNTNKIITFS